MGVDKAKVGSLSRRSLIGGAAALGSVGLAKAAVSTEANPDNLHQMYRSGRLILVMVLMLIPTVYPRHMKNT